MGGKKARASFTVGFTVESPVQDAAHCTDANRDVLVVVFNQDPSHTGFTATIYDTGSSASAPQPVPLARQGTSNVWQERVHAGNVPSSPPAQNNKNVKVQAFRGSVAASSLAPGFRAYFDPASGSGEGLRIAAQQRLQTSQPVPRAVRVHPGTPARKARGSSVLHRPLLLLYAQSPRFTGCWFSEPLLLEREQAASAYVMLQRAEADQWRLVLQHDETVVVAYRLCPGSGEPDAFPMRLQRAGRGDASTWPRTLTIMPA